MRASLVLRADGGPRIGAGHVMRCLALAQAWQDTGGQAVFVMAEPTPTLEARVQAEGMQVIRISATPGSHDDACQTVRLARHLDASWVVVDSYQWDTVSQRIVKDAGLRLLVMDDMGQVGRYEADLILNQNLHAHEGLYANRPSTCELLLGGEYVLLRREFLQWQEWRREIPSVGRNLLIMLGGSDPENLTLRLIEAFHTMEIEKIQVVVVIGGMNPYYSQLQEVIRSCRVPIRLEREVTRMAELMAWADVAISSGGTTVWECAFMGLPTIVGVIAEVEDYLVSGLRRHGLFLHLGWFRETPVEQLMNLLTVLTNDQLQRQHMSELGRRLINGQGCQRVLGRIRNGKSADW